jgi:hypothetical protein
VADLEQRVTTLEREVSVLKERVTADEEDVRNIPDLIDGVPTGEQPDGAPVA